MNRKEKSPHTNRLIHEKSPYLLQHAHNPVDWYPWGSKAFQQAQKESKAIFLSIGYATCHWCHVMERESFENENIARIMNEHFICIKVDREERPDLDNIYMSAVQLMTGQGGWPMSLFLTPEGKPFFGGTYWPPAPKWGQPGFADILIIISNSWKEKQKKIFMEAEEITAEIKAQSINKNSAFLSLDEQILHTTFESYQANYDSNMGGFGNAPKFPQPNNLFFLLRYYKKYQNSKTLEMVENTLRNMASGGIHDHLGGGFHRYSVDAEWLVPHFEKMLYDQALLARAYLETHQITRKTEYADIAKDIFTYVLRDMTNPSGAFYSAEDADSEGEEGKFYTWDKDEILAALGNDIGERFCTFYGVTDSGNFEGTNILHTEYSINEAAAKFKMSASALEEELKFAKKKLFEGRSKRTRPLLDDKILTAWNGLMISAFALGARVLDENIYSLAAEKSAKFILEKIQHNGRLLRRYRDEEAAIPGYVDDYAFFIMGLLDLYEATFNELWLKEAVRLTNDMTRLFLDKTNGGLLFSGNDGEKLITEFKDIYDGATPSGNSVAALNYFRLGHLTMNEELKNLGHQIIQTFSETIKQHGAAYPFMLMALDFSIGPNQEIVLCGEKNEKDVKNFYRCLNKVFLPNKVIAFNPNHDAENVHNLVPFLKGKTPLKGKATVYVCANYTCKLPVTKTEELEKILKEVK